MPGGSPARGDPLLGSVRIARDRLRVETNSIARADALRQRVEEACGDLVRHRTREHVDPLSEPLRRELVERPQETPPPEARQFILDFKRSHYATWLDEALPALGGKSPREAVRSPAGRAAVDVLLKEMENLEQRSPTDERFDFSELRRRLERDE